IPPRQLKICDSPPITSKRNLLHRGSNRHTRQGNQSHGSEPPSCRTSFGIIGTPNQGTKATAPWRVQWQLHKCPTSPSIRLLKGHLGLRQIRKPTFVSERNSAPQNATCPRQGLSCCALR